MHRIESNDKQQGLAMAWHGLTEVKETLTLDDNWLSSWDIQPTPLFTSEGWVVNNGEVEALGSVRATGHSILRATDDPEITIGTPYNPNSYRPITNGEFLGLLKDATEGVDGMKLVSVGSVRNRGRVFASFSTHALGEYDAGGRTFKPYFNAGNGHDQSSVLWTNTSNRATVCDNTYQMNLNEAEKGIVRAVKARHTKNVAMQLPDMGLMLRQANQQQINFATAFEVMAESKISFDDAERAFVGFVIDTDASEKELNKVSTRAKNIVGRLMELFKGGKGNKGETLADLFSAVTDYYTHENAGNGKNPQKQFQSSEFGTGSVTKQRFYNEVVKNGARDLIEKGAQLLK